MGVIIIGNEKIQHFSYKRACELTLKTLSPL